MIFNDVLDAMGHTPIIRLNRMVDEDSAEVLVKFEGLNVGGSIKSRTAYNIILDAEKKGLINKDSIIVEPTSGNQGIGLALVGAVRGYKTIIIMPDSVSEERRKLVQHYGAEVILIPEREFDFDQDVLRTILESKARGKKHSIIIVAEGIGGVIEMAKEIEEKTGIETRATILGHIQRGGSPSVRDRVVASRMGARAVELLIEGKSNRIVCMQENKVTDVDIEEGLSMKKSISDELIELAKKLTV